MKPLTIQNIRHYYFNKYIVTPFKKNEFPISYCYQYQALWFRVTKVASRTIDHHLNNACDANGYTYSTAVGYAASLYDDYYKFAFVRNPVDRFKSIFKEKVLKQNYFNFTNEQYQKRQNLKQFIDWVETIDIEYCDEHLMLQRNMIDLNNIDFIGHFEDFTSDFLTVAKEIDLPINESDLIHRNKSPKFEVKIDDNDRGRILEIYRKDVELFYPHIRI
jgi:hypothetical protein